MRNVLGNNLTVTLFGESHGEKIGAVVDGLSAGILVDEEYIKLMLSKRRPNGLTDTARVETDEFSIVSGVFNGKTTGAPLCILIDNKNVRSADYSEKLGLARPSHADYTAHVKYGGFEDYRGGGHFSGRITAPLVAVGAIITSALNQIGVKIGTHILSCAGVLDRSFSNVSSDIESLKSLEFPLLNQDVSGDVINAILSAKQKGDSVGGTTQTAIVGLPVGLGEPWFDSVESSISRAVFSIGGVKGIEFGLGFSFADKRASEVNDSLVKVDGKVVTLTNNNGGINGGITNGMPVIFNCAVKPTPSISIKQQTYNFITDKNEELQIKGRHDPAIIRRICPVLDAVSAIVVADLLVTKYGTDCLLKGF
ncbi:MAG: chorismate synthase [Clostridia bacterium]|nr:chorismate synthase [Clostridia bacterium]